MTSAWIWVGWAAVGAACGAFIGGYAPRLLRRTHRRGWILGPVVLAPTTAVLFGLFAWRLGTSFDLVIDSVVVATAVSASGVDILERRLPVVLIWPAYAAALATAGVGTAIQHDVGRLVHGLLGMTSLVAFYGLIAVASRGGLGLGDIRLAGLLGLSLGWQDWRALIAATALAFCAGGLVGVIALVTRRPRDAGIPFGPLMTGAALLVLSVLG